MPLPPALNDIKSELGYAYLHAVASRAGIACQASNRLMDNRGVDVHLNYLGKVPDTPITDVLLHAQLKSPSQRPTETATHIHYSLDDIALYNTMRLGPAARTVPLILMVTFLPGDDSQWLDVQEDHLRLCRATYWVSLWGAPPTTNTSSITIHLPKANLLTPASLTQLCIRIGQGNQPYYQQRP